MLAHLKAKQREQNQDDSPPSAVHEPSEVGPPTAEAIGRSTSIDAEKHDARLTCAALCSLSAMCCTPSNKGVTSGPPPSKEGGGECMMQHGGLGVGVPSTAIAVAEATPSSSAGPVGIHGFLFVDEDEEDDDGMCSKSRSLKGCPKQHQLPMFLSKTYHMIDRCDPEIATWSPTGDNFVVKNVDKFASSVLPLYFKHSNFSSFARQLNFYGFRKLRSDPILTNDVDPRTACYVRFYHEKFQKNRPEFLHQIKRATKSDQQSKDDVDGLKSEVWKLRECVQTMSAEMDRKLAEMSYEYNRRISNLSAEYEKLAGMVTQVLQQQQQQFHHQQQQHQAHLHHYQGHHSTPEVVDASIRSSAHVNSLQHSPVPPLGVPSSMHSSLVGTENKLQSLSQVVAMSLQNHHYHRIHPTTLPPIESGESASVTRSSSMFGEKPSCPSSAHPSTGSAGTKRVAPDDATCDGGVGKPRTS